MKLTLILSVILMITLFLMILVAVTLIKSKKLFTTAPKDIQAVTLDHKEPFKGSRVLGWILLTLLFFVLIGAFVYGGFDGIRDGYGFLQFFLRYIGMLYLWKVFDIIFLDWYLLTKSHFFQYFFPETEGCEGYHQFGFNRKEQLTQIIIFPFIALIMAWICMLF